MNKLLVIEDNPSSQKLIQQSLTDDGTEFFFADSASKAKTILKETLVDLIILDLGLPDLSDGYQLCMSLQSDSITREIPIFVITGHEEPSQKVTAFALGVEDYIVKPFNPLELRARIKAKLTRIQKTQDRSETIIKKNLKLNLGKQKAWHIANDQMTRDLELTPLEFKILYQLARHEDHVLSRSQLLDLAWGQSVVITDRTVDTHISTLRKKMGSISCYIQSITGEGYRFSTVD